MIPLRQFCDCFAFSRQLHLSNYLNPEDIKRLTIVPGENRAFVPPLLISSLRSDGSELCDRSAELEGESDAPVTEGRASTAAVPPTVHQISATVSEIERNPIGTHQGRGIGGRSFRPGNAQGNSRCGRVRVPRAKGWRSASLPRRPASPFVEVRP